MRMTAPREHVYKRWRVETGETPNGARGHIHPLIQKTKTKFKAIQKNPKFCGMQILMQVTSVQNFRVFRHSICENEGNTKFLMNSDIFQKPSHSQNLSFLNWITRMFKLHETCHGLRTHEHLASYKKSKFFVFVYFSKNAF